MLLLRPPRCFLSGLLLPRFHLHSTSFYAGASGSRGAHIVHTTSPHNVHGSAFKPYASFISYLTCLPLPCFLLSSLSSTVLSASAAIPSYHRSLSCTAPLFGPW
ncbi:hypothetical protein NEOLEDRAFT_346092 [Neolentinus lepideus HHB14362 ss-1]|uniref:Uncharacterized protein n=1 Tax=Neolentinus lepideus HHB14362 ss-1 TaxID=1314782 RepID=A0A165SQ44_9AGAM|nr:hypothetical protein NEOLEDRAFT_346092 [Neolentinus lepideus HHB14362 ss-1]